MTTQHDATDLDQGFFKFPVPTWKGMIGYAIALSMFMTAMTMFSSGQSIPDIPQLSEADRLDELGDIDSYNFQLLQDGYEQPQYQSNKAAFLLVPLELEEGRIGTEGCYESEDDEGNTEINYGYDIEEGSVLTFRDQAGDSITSSFDKSGTLDPEGDFFSQYCTETWHRDVKGYGQDNSENRILMAYMLVQNEPNEYYQLLSFTEINGFNDYENPPEITQREDAGRFALLASGIGGLIFMYSTPTSLSYALRKIRKSNQTNAKETASAAGVLGSDGRQFQHCGPHGEIIGPANQLFRDAYSDWLFGCPPLPTSYSNVFTKDGDGSLIPEHPQRIGTPRPAMMTPYSLGALTFALSFIWLSSDLRARDGSEIHTLIGYVMTFFVTIINILWFFSAYKQAKLSQTINDLPTSPIRSVAVGQAEVVGQVRPSSAGTPAFTVGGEEMQGTVLWTWSSYKYVCRQTDDGQECGWEHRETKNGGVPFVLHDGTGGMIIDPSLWQAENKTLNLGSCVAAWESGKWKWTVNAIGVGDPLYVLGDCVPRSREHLDAWGGDETEGSALVTMVPSTETGEGSIMSLGTELDVVAQRRSRFEMLIVPIIVFTFGIFMFLNYTP